MSRPKVSRLPARTEAGHVVSDRMASNQVEAAVGAADMGGVTSVVHLGPGPFTLDPGPQLQPGNQATATTTGLISFHLRPPGLPVLDFPNPPSPSTNLRARCHTPAALRLRPSAHANHQLIARACPSRDAPMSAKHASAP
jgi:hypothetical protein